VSDAPRLKAKYLKDIVPSLTTEFKYSNPHQVPKLEKIVVNMGVGEAARDSKVLEGAVADMAIITGQKPQITKAKKSIAQFKLREGQAIGCFVTLRPLARKFCDQDSVRSSVADSAANGSTPVWEHP